MYLVIKGRFLLGVWLFIMIILLYLGIVAISYDSHCSYNRSICISNYNSNIYIYILIHHSIYIHKYIYTYVHSYIIYIYISKLHLISF